MVMSVLRMEVEAQPALRAGQRGHLRGAGR